MRQRHGWLLAPQDEHDLYPFLLRATQEWAFFSNAEVFGFPVASKPVVAGATIARNDAVDMWNQMMWQQAGRDWWLVHQHYTLDEDWFDERRGVLLTASTNLLVVHRCESVLATINRTLRIIFGPDGRELPLGDEEQVELHCVLSPPRDDTLKILPINLVPKVAPFNH